MAAAQARELRARLLLAAYAAGVVAATTIHRPLWLAMALGGLVALAGRDALRIARRALVGVLVFNATVSSGYLLLGWLAGGVRWEYLLLLNLRVLLLTYLSLLFVSRFNLFEAARAVPTLAYLLTLAYSQLLSFRRILADFVLAARSRTIRRPPLLQRYGQAVAASVHLLEKAESNAAEIAQAMRSRGFFGPQAGRRDG